MAPLGKHSEECQVLCKENKTELQHLPGSHRDGTRRTTYGVYRSAQIGKLRHALFTWVQGETNPKTLRKPFNVLCTQLISSGLLIFFQFKL